MIKGIPLPNNNTIKISGYADDTNILVADYESITNIFNVLTKFELATGALLNKAKTNIFGIGAWKDRTNWPISWLCSNVNWFESLGVLYANDYHLALAKNWDNILSAIKIKLRIMQFIKLSIYQKAILINCLVYARL